jgi:hypothetical protein
MRLSHPFYRVDREEIRDALRGSFLSGLVMGFPIGALAVGLLTWGLL